MALYAVQRGQVHLTAGAVLAVLLGLVSTAYAQTITVVIQLMPREAVVERCADETIADEIERQLRAQMGCIGWLPAMDNPNDVFCQVFVPRLPDRPWDEAFLAERLRPLCGQGQGR